MDKYMGQKKVSFQTDQLAFAADKDRQLFLDEM
jgi:hypothetical protein